MAWIFLVAALAPSVMEAQRVTGGAAVQTYAMSDAEAVRLHDIRLGTVTFGTSAPLLAWASVSLAGGWATANVTLPNGARAETAGPVDTRVAVELRPYTGLTIRGSALLPTGEVPTSLEEAYVVGLLSTDLFPFAVTQWGTGGGGGADVSYAARAGHVSTRISAGGLLLFGSRPLGFEQVVYQPGPQIHAQGAIEAPIGEAGVLSALLGVQRFAPDRYRSTTLFQAGLRVEGVLSYAFPLGSRESALAYARLYRLGEGALTGEPPEYLFPDDALPGAHPQPSRQVFAAGAEMRVSRGLVEVMPHGGFRILRRGDGRAQGWLASGGIRGAVRVAGGRLGRRAIVEPSLALRIGQLVANAGARSGVLGWDAGMTIRWEGGR